MASPVLTRETFRFFEELARNNRTEWMRAHRSRYEEHVVAPLRALLEALTPVALSLHADFDTRGRVGTSFSRINRDTRFARDKRPYRPQMYLLFRRTFSTAAAARAGFPREVARVFRDVFPLYAFTSLAG